MSPPRTVRELRAEGWLPLDVAPDDAHPLVLQLDAGGERWHLAGKPIHAGRGVELLIRGAITWCPTCNADGACPDCGGAGQWYSPAWLPVAFEYRNAGDGSGVCYLYPGTFGLWNREPHAIQLDADAGRAARARWAR